MGSGLESAHGCQRDFEPGVSLGEMTGAELNRSIEVTLVLGGGLGQPIVQCLLGSVLH